MTGTFGYTTSRSAEGVARWSAIILGASIPISVALDNLLVAVILLAWVPLLYLGKLSVIRRNPIVWATTGLVLFYLAGCTYSLGNLDDILDGLSKAARLMLIPLLLVIFQDADARRYAWRGFMGAMLLTLFLSYLLWLGLLPEWRFISGQPANPTIFKLHITHSLFMAFTAFSCAAQARQAIVLRQRSIWLALALLAAFNVLYMVQGRTGQLVLILLFAYLWVAWLRWKGLAIAFAAIGSLVVAAYLLPSSSLHQRTVLAYQEFSSAHPEVAATTGTSIGQRLEFYRNTLEIIRQHPLLGVGTGGFKQAYAMQVSGTDRLATHNPHNEYLMVGAQLGLAGLLLLLGLFAAQWHMAARLPTIREQMLARGMVLSIVTASAVSSTLMDHAESWFYVWMSGLLFATLKSGQCQGNEQQQ